MNSTIIAAAIGATATVLAALIALVPFLIRRKTRTYLATSATDSVLPSERRVFFNSKPYRFLNFGGKHCRIESLDGSPSFLAPTHEIYHDPACTERITRESIIM